jgi:guanylate kinase
MARRLEVARRELLEAHRYRHRVVNERVDEALADVERILAAEGLEPAPHDRGTATSTTDKPPAPSGVNV